MFLYIEIKFIRFETTAVGFEPVTFKSVRYFILRILYQKKN